MKKLTIIKIGDENSIPTNEELHKIRDFVKNNETIVTDYFINIQTIEYNDSDEFEIEHSYTPSKYEISEWQNVFSQIKDDPDFTIFTYSQVNIKLKSKQISHCKRCNIQNEYMEFNSDWICLSCKS